MLNPDYLLIPRPDDPLDAAITFFGSKAELARSTGYTSQAVHMWQRRGFVPRPAARAIELATDGQVPMHEFSPFGEARG